MHEGIALFVYGQEAVHGGAEGYAVEDMGFRDGCAGLAEDVEDGFQDSGGILFVLAFGFLERGVGLACFVEGGAAGGDGDGFGGGSAYVDSDEVLHMGVVRVEKYEKWRSWRKRQWRAGEKGGRCACGAYAMEVPTLSRRGLYVIKLVELLGCYYGNYLLLIPITSD